MRTGKIKVPPTPGVKVKVNNNAHVCADEFGDLIPRSARAPHHEKVVSCGGWIYDAQAFAPARVPIVMGHFPTLAACEQARDAWLERDPSGPYRCVPE